MAEITNIRPAYDVSPVLAGFLGAGVLVVSVTVAVFLWTCCQRRYRQLTGAYKVGGEAGDPPYRFIHMLKGVSIYPETLSSSKKIVRVARRPGSHGRGPWNGGRAGSALLVDAAESGLLGGAERQSALPPEGGSPGSSDTSGCSSSTSKAASPFSPAEDRPLGTLSLAVDYNFPKKALVVTIVGAQGLPAVDGQSGSSDPYVKMTILPEKKHRVKTRVMRKSLEPAFDETFTFYGVPYSSLPELVLHFLVLSFDRFSRDDVIGEAVVPLAGVDPSTGRILITQQICKRSIQCVSRGELLVSLSYQPVTHRLNVTVMKAKQLPRMDITGPSGNPYVKVNVFFGRKRVAKKKTHVKKGTLNPVFNESFVFDVPPELLHDVSVELLVLDFDRTTKNEVVGRLVLAAHSSAPSAASQWHEVMENPRKQVTKWQTLSEH